MKRMKIYNLIIASLAFGFVVFSVSANPALAAPPVLGNLIINPDMQIASSTSPANWQISGYNDAFTSVYPDPVAGPFSGDKAAKITTINHNNGDAKWVFDDVAVSEGALYTFSDYYKSTVPTSLVAAFTLATGTEPTLFTTLTDLTSSGGTWQKSTVTVTVPLGYSKMTIYHTIAAVGVLATTDYSLILSASAANNLFPTGMVSLTFDDGWSAQYDNALPILKNANLKGTFYIVSKKMQDASIVTADNLLSTTRHPDVLKTLNNSSTVWANIYTDPTSKTYRFTDSYTSAQPSTVEASYLNSSNNIVTITLGALPASPSTPNRASFVFTLPGTPINTVSPISISHWTASGTLTISNATLTDYDLYMNTSQVLESKNSGIEIGNHTVNHCNLVSGLCPDAVIPNSIDLLTPSQEVNLAKDALLSIAPLSSNTLAYPYGAFNTSTKSILSDAGIITARSVNAGYNTKYSDKLALYTQVVDASTPITRVYNWIDNAIRNKWWLILTFHQVEDQATINANNDTGAITPETLTNITNYLNGIETKTMTEAALLMGSTLPPAPNSFTINSTAGAGGTISPIATSTVASGTNQTYTITPDSGYNVATLLVDSTPVTATTSYTFTNVTANHTISATFGTSTPLASFTINATAGAGGTISPIATSTVASGTNQTYAITPDAGYNIATLMIDATSTATTTSYTFTNVTANHIISATFGTSTPLATFTINASAGAGGTISPIATSTVASGTNQTYTITPDSGYNIATLMIDATSTTATSSYTFTNVTANHTISATFGAVSVPVVITPPSSGGGGGGGGGSYLPGYIEAINVPLVISPEQSGRAILNLENGRKITVYLPAKTVQEKTIITIMPVKLSLGDTYLQGLPADILIMNNTIFKITAINQFGKEITTFAKDLTITLDLDSSKDLTNSAVYYYEMENKRWIMVPSGIIDPTKNQVSFNVNHLTMFSIIQSSSLSKVIYYLTPAPVTTTPAVLGVKVYANGSLVRTPDKRIYVIDKGKRVHIRNLKELAKYRKIKIANVSYEDLVKYPIKANVISSKK